MVEIREMPVGSSEKGVKRLEGNVQPDCEMRLYPSTEYLLQDIPRRESIIDYLHEVPQFSQIREYAV